MFDLHRSPEHGRANLETFPDDLRQRLGQHVAIAAPQCRIVAVQQAASGRIQDAELSVTAHHQQTRRQTLDDFAAEPLRRLGARRHLAFLRLHSS